MSPIKRQQSAAVNWDQVKFSTKTICGSVQQWRQERRTKIPARDRNSIWKTAGNRVAFLVKITRVALARTQVC